MESKQIPLELILCDNNWNSRSGNWTSDEEYQNLLLAIKEEGIKDPLEVRPLSLDIKNYDYSLVAGFRRFAVAKELKLSTVPCIINDMTETAARIRNIQENTQRANLRVQDICYAIGQIRNSATQKELAMKTGIGQPQICKYIKIYEQLKPTIFSKWRNDINIKIPLQDIYELAGLPKDKQDESFKNLIEIISNSETKRGRSTWMRSASRKVYQLGFTIGRLIDRGMIGNVETNSAQWSANDISMLLDLPRTASIEKVEELAKIFCDAINKGVKNERN